MLKISFCVSPIVLKMERKDETQLIAQRKKKKSPKNCSLAHTRIFQKGIKADEMYTTQNP